MLWEKNMQAHRSHSFVHFISRSAPVLFAIALAACTTQKQLSVVDAAVTPLSDLNLVQAKIPAVLAKAQKAPYAVPSDQSCTSLDASVRALDEVLGTDIDVTDSDRNPGLIKQGSRVAEKATVDTLRLTAEGIVPFRGWVRKLSGSERHSKQVAAAIAAGIIRRAFIKGFRVSKECP